MIYECDKCGSELPPGVTVCPNCGDPFEAAVPADAEVPGERLAAKPDSPPPVTEQVPPLPAQPQPDRVPRYARKWVAPVAIIGIVILTIVFVRAAKHRDAPAGPLRASSRIAPRSPDTAPSKVTTPSAPERSDLEVLNHKAGSGTGEETFITGQVRNNTDRTLGHAQVTFNFYDKYNKQVGSVRDDISNLKPHAIWVYKATGMGDKSADHYKLAGVTDR